MLQMMILNLESPGPAIHCDKLLLFRTHSASLVNILLCACHYVCRPSDLAILACKWFPWYQKFDNFVSVSVGKPGLQVVVMLNAKIVVIPTAQLDTAMEHHTHQ